MLRQLRRGGSSRTQPRECSVHGRRRKRRATAVTLPPLLLSCQCYPLHKGMGGGCSSFVKVLPTENRATLASERDERLKVCCRSTV